MTNKTSGKSNPTDTDQASEVLQFGYETRDDTKEFDPTTPNGKLMAAVCGEIKATIEREARKKAIDDVKKAGYGYDDGTGFVLKISFAELAHLNQPNKEEQ